AQSSLPGFLGGFPAECSWVALPRVMFDQLQGYDPAFQSPGGGLVNHDFIVRAADLPDTAFIVLLGEGVFHQIHGGVATNVNLRDHPYKDFDTEYEKLRNRRYHRPEINDIVYYGSMPEAARRFLAS
uniref:hypothetical protein n=1 Tax=Roseovarius conchicola TaxID=3121636 RepID=UPI0035290DA9